MPRPRVYVETTIPSAYYERRSTPGEVVRRECTRKWWRTAGLQYELVVSGMVVAELRAGPPEYRQDWLSLIRDLPLLEYGSRIDDIVRSYLLYKLMPRAPANDAVHLAYASHYSCAYLVTWDSRHLANPNKFAQIRRINAKLGLSVPRIVTPRELLGEAT